MLVAGAMALTSCAEGLGDGAGPRASTVPARDVPPTTVATADVASPAVPVSDEASDVPEPPSFLSDLRWDASCQEVLDGWLEVGAALVAIYDSSQDLGAGIAELEPRYASLSVRFEQLGCSWLHFDVHAIDRVDEIQHATSHGFVLKQGLIEPSLFRVGWEYYGMVHLVVESEDGPYEAAFPAAPDAHRTCEEAWEYELSVMAAHIHAVAATSDEGIFEDSTPLDAGYAAALAATEAPADCDPSDRAVYLVEREGELTTRNFWARFTKYAFYEDVNDELPDGYAPAALAG